VKIGSLRRLKGSILNNMKIYRIIIFVGFLFLMSIALVYGINRSVENTATGKLFNVETVFKKQTALILGAKVWDNGEMSDMFKDRVIVGIDLYKKGKVDKILVSGDHGTKEYDEVNPAKIFLLENGVNPDDIFLDYAGFDTYDSLYRAKEIFKAESLIIVTQEFHLIRALYIAKKLGIESMGVDADLRPYVGAQYQNIREKLARVKAWLNTTFKSKPKYLGNEIPLSGKGQLSWD